MKGKCNIRMGQGERLCSNGCEGDERSSSCVVRRVDPDNERKRRRGEGYERRRGIDDGRCGIDSEIVGTRGEGKVREMNKVKDRWQGSAASWGREVGHERDEGPVGAV